MLFCKTALNTGSPYLGTFGCTLELPLKQIDSDFINNLTEDYEVSILSGDSYKKVQKFGELLGVKDSLGDQTPEDKVSYAKCIFVNIVSPP